MCVAFLMFNKQKAVVKLVSPCFAYFDTKDQTFESSIHQNYAKFILCGSFKSHTATNIYQNNSPLYLAHTDTETKDFTLNFSVRK